MAGSRARATSGAGRRAADSSTSRTREKSEREGSPDIGTARKKAAQLEKRSARHQRCSLSRNLTLSHQLFSRLEAMWLAASSWSALCRNKICAKPAWHLLDKQLAVRSLTLTLNRGSFCCQAAFCLSCCNEKLFSPSAVDRHSCQ